MALYTVNSPSTPGTPAYDARQRERELRMIEQEQQRGQLLGDPYSPWYAPQNKERDRTARVQRRGMEQDMALGAQQGQIQARQAEQQLGAANEQIMRDRAAYGQQQDDDRKRRSFAAPLERGMESLILGADNPGLPEATMGALGGMVPQAMEGALPEYMRGPETNSQLEVAREVTQRGEDADMRRLERETQIAQMKHSQLIERDVIGAQLAMGQITAEAANRKQLEFYKQQGATDIEAYQIRSRALQQRQAQLAEHLMEYEGLKAEAMTSSRTRDLVPGYEKNITETKQLLEAQNAMIDDLIGAPPVVNAPQMPASAGLLGAPQSMPGMTTGAERFGGGLGALGGGNDPAMNTNANIPLGGGPVVNANVNAPSSGLTPTDTPTASQQRVQETSRRTIFAEARSRNIPDSLTAAALEEDPGASAQDIEAFWRSLPPNEQQEWERASEANRR